MPIKNINNIDNRAMIQSSKEVRNFLKLKVTEELVKGNKIVMNDIIFEALKLKYGKDFTNFIKEQRRASRG